MPRPESPGISRRGLLPDSLGKEVEDASEETFLLFSHQLPSQNLGYADPKASELTISIGDRDIEVRQSPGLLTSKRRAGTTGAVLWNISPLVASWLLNQTCLLWTASILSPIANVIELGCGITGIIGISLSPFIAMYLLTDQEYVMKTLRENVESHTGLSKPRKSRARKELSDRDGLPRLRTLTLDWELDSASNVQRTLGPDQNIDLVIACDCVYNDFLIKPFVSTCAELCQKSSPEGKRPVLLVAQQLRSEDIFEAWLQTTMELFHVWRVPAQYLSKELEDGSGYVLHLAMLKENHGHI